MPRTTIDDIAAALAGHFGPAFASLPNDRAQRRDLERQHGDCWNGNDKDAMRDAARDAAKAMLAGIADKSLRTHIALAMFGAEGAKLAA